MDRGALLQSATEMVSTKFQHPQVVTGQCRDQSEAPFLHMWPIPKSDTLALGDSQNQLSAITRKIDEMKEEAASAAGPPPAVEGPSQAVVEGAQREECRVNKLASEKKKKVIITSELGVLIGLAPLQQKEGAKKVPPAT